MFIPAGRIIMCIVAWAISTMFEHMAQQVAISEPCIMSLPAHIAAAIARGVEGLHAFLQGI